MILFNMCHVMQNVWKNVSIKVNNLKYMNFFLSEFDKNFNFLMRLWGYDIISDILKKMQTYIHNIHFQNLLFIFKIIIIHHI